MWKDAHFYYSQIIQPHFCYHSTQHNILYAITCQDLIKSSMQESQTYSAHQTSMQVRMHTRTKQAFIYTAKANQQPAVYQMQVNTRMSEE